VNIEEILPGKPVEVEITPDKPGRYAFACIRWCSLDHWRMRGAIEVEGETVQPLPTEPPPLFQQLGIDLDAMHPTPEALPSKQPSASEGAGLGATLPKELSDPATRRAIAPADAFQTLRNDSANAALSDDDVWNLVAWAWLKGTTPAAWNRAEELYARDCAACHGQNGKGDGVAGRDLPGLAKMDQMMHEGPADFTDPHGLAASDAYLQGKMLRGGMGTGMPEFGSLYTDEELWAMVAYVRGFLFHR
jgi:mono/diheme cytochrome c family protein